MKKLFKITTILLLVTMAFNLIACSSFGRVQKALEDEGYALIQGEENEASQEAKDDERVAKVYVFKNSALISTYVTVIEFKSTKKLVEYYKENNTLQGIVADIEEDGTAEEVYIQLKKAGFACGNCIIVPIGLDANDVLDEMKELNNYDD